MYLIRNKKCTTVSVMTCKEKAVAVDTPVDLGIRKLIHKVRHL